MKLAKNILIGGLALQVVAFGVFLFVAIFFDFKASRGLGKEAIKPLRPLFMAFYASGILITARSIYRTVGRLPLPLCYDYTWWNCIFSQEFASVTFTPGVDDPQGYAVTHEWCLYVFDTLPIVVSITSVKTQLPGSNSSFRSRSLSWMCTTPENICLPRKGFALMVLTRSRRNADGSAGETYWTIL